jgi:uncharacterized YceG family protein
VARTPEDRRRAAAERARRRAVRPGDEDALTMADPTAPDSDPADTPVPPQWRTRSAVVERPPMSRAARAQRVGRPGRPGLPAHSPPARRLARRLLALLALLVIAGALYVINATFQPFHGEGRGSVAVDIPAGVDAGRIGEILAQRGVVADARFFELNATLTLRRGDLREGSYVLRREMSNGQAIEALMQGPKVKVVETFTVTIPEGRSRRETAPLVRDAGVRGSYLRASGSRATLRRIRALGAPRGTDTAEGFLFPATYELEVGARARGLVRRQLDAFEENFGGLNLRYARRRKLTRYDVLTIASMVEREAQLDRERPLVAAVIYNRLKHGMPLGIDATIRYGVNNWTRPLLQSELDRDTPYNSRLRTGLPPTPIGNPGLASMRAAARPANVDFLYYVVKPGTCGEHAFSSTDAQRQRDVARYNAAREARGGRSPDTC